ncbi:MAG: LapA family protein [Bacteroidales bacterium]
MLKLLLFTIQMMGLTFLIGFIVAAVIKMTALAADYFEFHNSHELELRRLKQLKRRRRKRIFDKLYDAQELEIEIMEQHINGTSYGASSSNAMDFHGVSPGVSSFDLLDYYNSAHNSRYKRVVDKSSSKNNITKD